MKINYSNLYGSICFFRLKHLMRMWKRLRIFCKDAHRAWPISCSTFAISHAVLNSLSSWKWRRWKRVTKVSIVLMVLRMHRAQIFIQWFRQFMSEFIVELSNSIDAQDKIEHRRHATHDHFILYCVNCIHESWFRGIDSICLFVVDLLIVKIFRHAEITLNKFVIYWCHVGYSMQFK